MSIALPSVLDTATASVLHSTFCDAIGRDEALLIDGSAVERVGQACLQVLAAATVQAQRSGFAFRIDEPSAPLAEMAKLAGLDSLLSA